MAQLSPVCNMFSPKPAANSEHAMEEGKTVTCPNSLVSGDDTPTNLHKRITELVGTYILIFAGVGSILLDGFHPITAVGIATVWGLAVMALVYTLGHISGGHFNPAVTIAFAASRKLPWKQVPSYIGSQLVASTLACLTLYMLYSKRNIGLASAVNGFSVPTTDLEAIIWEFIVSFILMFVICGVATDHRAVSKLAGVAVGSTVLLNIIITGPITGCSVNPARSIGPALVAGRFDKLWIFILSPTLGMVAAAFVYGTMRPPPEPETTKEIMNRSMIKFCTYDAEENDLASVCLCPNEALISSMFL